MREIKFRGLCVETNEWIVGNLYVDGDKCEILEDEYINTEHAWKEVDKDSVGQYINHEDQNDQEIYEGDIVDCYRYGTVYRVVVRDIRKIPMEMFGSNVDLILVVGNIHQHPELLNVG